MEKETLTENELAEVLGLTPRALRRKVEAEQIPKPFLTGTKSKRWSRRAIQRWLDAQAEPTTAGK